MYLNWMEDGLQHGENIAEEEVPGLCQGVEQLLTFSNDTTKTFILHLCSQDTFNVIQMLCFVSGTFVEPYFVPKDDHAFCEQLVLWIRVKRCHLINDVYRVCCCKMFNFDIYYKNGS